MPVFFLGALVYSRTSCFYRLCVFQPWRLADKEKSILLMHQQCFPAVTAPQTLECDFLQRFIVLSLFLLKPS